jgi:hypothetical protein
MAGTAALEQDTDLLAIRYHVWLTLGISGGAERGPLHAVVRQRRG